MKSPVLESVPFLSSYHGVDPLSVFGDNWATRRNRLDLGNVKISFLLQGNMRDQFKRRVLKKEGQYINSGFDFCFEIIIFVY